MLNANVRDTAGRISRQKSFACCFVMPADSIHIRINVSVAQRSASRLHYNASPGEDSREHYSNSGSHSNGGDYSNGGDDSNGGDYFTLMTLARPTLFRGTFRTDENALAVYSEA